MATGAFDCINNESGLEIPEDFRENLAGDTLYCWLEVDDDGLTCVSVYGEGDYAQEDVADRGVALMRAEFSGGILHLPDELRKKLGENCVAAAVAKGLNIWTEDDWEVVEERLTPENFAAALDELGL